MDENLTEKRGLWDNIHAKRERIKHGSGEHMRKPGSKGAPTAAALKASQSEEYTGSESTSTNMEDPASRFVGTTALTNTYKSMTPGYSKAQTVKRVVKELAVRDAAGHKHNIGKNPVREIDGKIHMEYPGKSSSSGGGGK